MLQTVRHVDICIQKLSQLFFIPFSCCDHDFFFFFFTNLLTPLPNNSHLLRNASPLLWSNHINGCTCDSAHKPLSVANWSGFIHFLVWNGINKICSWTWKLNLCLLMWVTAYLIVLFGSVSIFGTHQCSCIPQGWLLTTKVNISEREEQRKSLLHWSGFILHRQTAVMWTDFLHNPALFKYSSRLQRMFFHLLYKWILFWFEITYMKPLL